MSLDIQSSRRARPYSICEYVGRILWILATPLFRFSPRPMFGWRRMLLRCFRARVGERAHVYPSARIEMPWMLALGDESSIGEHTMIYNLGAVTIGDRATISHMAHLCAGTHDFCDPALPLQRTPIAIGNDAWVCANAFVGPGVVVGEGAIVGAGAVATSDVQPWTIVAGNPARFIKPRVMRPEGA